MAMITEIKQDNVAMWLCTNYGVTMSAEHAEAFCARRYLAANQNDSYTISFSLCRKCPWGEKAYKLAKQKGGIVPGCRKIPGHAKSGSFGRF